MAYDWVTGSLITKLCNSTAIYENSPKYNFGWWFAYFWKEVGSKIRDEEKLKEVIALVFADQFPKDIATKSFGERRKASEQVANNFTRLLPQPKDLNSNAAHYRGMLTKLLQMGFREMPGVAVTGPGAAQVKEMFADRIAVNKGGNTLPVAIAYRGEGREFKMVIQHGGAQSRADLGLLNMDQKWHPFSDPLIGGKTYARAASGDNCLFTVTSIGRDIQIPVGFPLIEDEDIYSVPTLPATEATRTLEKWNYKLLREAQGKSPVFLAKAAISGVGKPSGIFLATESFVYAVKIKSANHTQDFVESTFAMPQDQCKERGVRGIKLKNFLAGAKLRRIHLGPARVCGVTAFVQEIRYCLNGKWVPQTNAADFAKAHFYGDVTSATTALNMIQAQFNGPGGTRVLTGECDEAMAPNPTPVVSQIEQWNLTFDQFNSLRNNQSAKLYFGATK